ncbi:hypothetical protein [Cryobacterium frigoriphilum]|uniref:hypothetical protein n=1 Tax=Cryobacterium frigoriphilum TaxID=1259150 RepID=UPI00141AE1C2|nr:hypothetical protein [Cryobacterium frigoriphilum]
MPAPGYLDLPDACRGIRLAPGDQAASCLGGAAARVLACWPNKSTTVGSFERVSMIHAQSVNPARRPARGIRRLIADDQTLLQ